MTRGDAFWDDPRVISANRSYAKARKQAWATYLAETASACATWHAAVDGPNAEWQEARRLPAARLEAARQQADDARRVAWDEACNG